MIYYELVEKTFSNRGKIIPSTELSVVPRDYKAFVSHFGYGDQILDWVDINGSVEDYDKEFHLHAFYVDIDSDDLSVAQTETQKLVKLLYRKYDLHPDNLMIFFSGGKGFHVGIPGKVFGGFEPSSQLPYQAKAMAKNLAGDDVDIDYSIYKPNALFRLPDSKHGKTGLFKVPITLEELGGDIEDIQKIAEYPRPEFAQRKNINDVVVNDKLKTLWQRSSNDYQQINDGDKMRLKDGGFFKPVTELRNNTYFKQAAMLFDKGLRMADVLDLIKSTNYASGNPLPDNEVYTLVKSAYKKTGSGKAKDEKVLTQKGTGLVSDLVPAYLDYLSPSNKKLSLLFPDFSADTKHKLRGKLIGVFGKDGTKKSLFCQNTAYHNIRKYGARVIISNMEMGENPLMSRLINRAMRDYKKTPSIDMEEEMMRGDDLTVRKKLDMVAKHYSDKLIVNSQSAMTPAAYRKLIERNEKKFGKVDMLIVDGFSMMGGASDRFQRQDDNSRELKEIAKDYDIAILAIFHANASCTKYERRPDRKVRGSDKQLDNIDIAISLSLIIDDHRSKNITDLYYRDDLGYALMYNKRGSGNVIRKLYKFHPARLAMKAIDDDPADYEVNPNRL